VNINFKEESTKMLHLEQLGRFGQ